MFAIGDLQTVQSANALWERQFYRGFRVWKGFPVFLQQVNALFVPSECWSKTCQESTSREFQFQRSKVYD